MLKEKINASWPATIVLAVLLGTFSTQAQTKLSCPYTIANYLSRTICFNYEVRGSVYGRACSTLYEGNACLQRSENGQPTFWKLDTLCSSASDIIITIKSCGGCTLNPRPSVAGQCESTRIDSSHTPCCRNLRIKWDGKEAMIY